MTDIIRMGKIYQEDLARGTVADTVVLADGTAASMNPLLTPGGYLRKEMGGFGQAFVGGWPSTLSGFATTVNALDGDTLDIGAGDCTSDDADPADRVQLSLGATLSKDLGASWAAGTGAGGLDSGAVADGSYFVFAIYNPTTQATDALFSSSPTTPTLPTGYTKQRRIWAIVRTGGSIKPYAQMGNLCLWKTPVKNVASISNFGIGGFGRAVTVPNGLRVLWRGFVYNINTGAVENVFLGNDEVWGYPTVNDVYVTVSTPFANTAIGVMVDVPTRTDAMINSAHSLGNAATTFALTTHGYVDYQRTA